MIIKKPLLSSLLMLIAAILFLGGCGNNQESLKDEGFSVSVSMPKRTFSQGQNLELKVQLQNQTLYNKNLEAIILPAALVNEMRLLGTQPAMPRAINSDGDWVFEIKRSIAPQGSETFSFTFKTIGSGVFSGLAKVQTTDGSATFEMSLNVVGVNPAGWKPGAAKTLPEEVTDEPAYLSVVKIDAVAEVNGQDMLLWHGTGTIISPDGLILTSADLVLSDRYFQIKDIIISLTVDDQAAPVPTYRAAIVQADYDLGLAIIKPKTTMQGKAIDYALLELPAIKLGDSTLVERGDNLLALAYPAVSNAPELLQQASIQVNDFGSEFPIGTDVLIHAQRAVPSGFAGAPVLNEAGELVAVPVHKSPITFDPDAEECKALVDANRDGRIDALDPCHRILLPVDTLRTIDVALPFIDAARRGELAINAAGHSEGYLHSQAILAGLDDFSNNQNQWKISNTDLGEQKIEGGSYLFKLHKPMTTLDSSVDFAYDAMLVETDLRVLEPVYNGEFGVLCGVNSDNKTVFAISENGYFAIWKVIEGRTRFLRQWQYSPAINTGETLRLSVQCSAKGHSFAVNGAVLANVVDSAFVPGLTGLYAATYDKGGFVLGFDTFSVSILEE